jgi:hypothetical protein
VSGWFCTVRHILRFENSNKIFMGYLGIPRHEIVDPRGDNAVL